jgi:hypothetical protein
LTHWYHTSREWVKKAVLMNGLYVLNNPWTIQSMEKHTTYVAMMRLGLPIPKTWLVPPKSYDQTPDLQPTLERYAKLFDLGEVGKKVGYPLFMKPYDGGAWRGVSKIDNESALKAAYDVSGKNVMHLQKAVAPFDLFVRALGVGPQVRVMKYDPAAPLHDRYVVAKEAEFVSAKEREHLAAVCLTINAFFGWDFNSCESLKKGGTFHPIDFANACPDSQVTSLHYHFPWLVNVRSRRCSRPTRSSSSPSCSSGGSARGAPTWPRGRHEDGWTVAILAPRARRQAGALGDVRAAGAAVPHRGR